MNTFDRHIIKRFLLGYLFLVIGLIVFFIVLHYLEYTDDFMDRGASMKEVFSVYYPNYIPEIVRLTSPLAIFLACVYLTGKLAQHLEITALQTSGVSLYRLLRPYVFVALLVTGMMFWFNGWVVPQTQRVVLDFESRYLKDAPRMLDMNDISRQNLPGSYVTVGHFDRRSNVAHRVSLQHYDQDRLVRRIDSDRMDWLDSLAIWRLHKPIIRTFKVDGAIQRETVATLDTMLNVLPRDMARTERDVESMTIPAAAEYVEALKRSGANNIGKTLVAYYAKFSYPFANLILVLIAVPLAAVRRRGGQTIRMALGLFTAFVYLTLMKLIEPFGYSGEIQPEVAAWVPHLTFALVAIVMLLRARK